MKKITLKNYKTDKYYIKICKATHEILSQKKIISVIELLQHLGMLDERDLNNWYKGRVSYLERVIHGNLSKISRILRIFRMHAHDLNLSPSHKNYVKHGKGKKLQFSKSGTPRIEKEYALNFIVLGKNVTQN